MRSGAVPARSGRLLEDQEVDFPVILGDIRVGLHVPGEPSGDATVRNAFASEKCGGDFLLGGKTLFQQFVVVVGQLYQYQRVDVQAMLLVFSHQLLSFGNRHIQQHLVLVTTLILLHIFLRLEKNLFFDQPLGHHILMLHRNDVGFPCISLVLKSTAFGSILERCGRNFDDDFGIQWFDDFVLGQIAHVGVALVDDEHHAATCGRGFFHQILEIVAAFAIELRVVRAAQHAVFRIA